MKKWIILLCSLCSVESTAAWVTKDKSAKISYINVESSGARIGLTGNDLSSGDCDKSNVVYIDTTSEQGKLKYSTLLAAHMAQKSIVIWASGCKSGWGTSYPAISAIYVYR